MRAHLRLFHLAQGKAQIVELRSGGGEQEIALVARRVGGGMQFGAVRAFDPADIMAGGQRLGAKFARRVHQVGELDFLIAADAGNRGFAPGIGVGEILDHIFAEAAFVIEHIMGNAERVGDALGVIDILAGAAGAFSSRRVPG